jgi:hypothetical protein
MMNMCEFTQEKKKKTLSAYINMIVWTCVRVTTNVSIPATLNYKIQLILYQVDNRDFKCYFSFFLFSYSANKFFSPYWHMLVYGISNLVLVT